MDIFISHIHEEKSLAIAIKNQLERVFGKAVSVFVATEVIGPGDDWFGRIRSALRRANVILTLFSPYSCERAWINIETGYGVMMGGKKVIPLCCFNFPIENLPSVYDRYQATKIDSKDDVRRLLEKIGEDADCKVEITNPDIQRWLHAIRGETPRATEYYTAIGDPPNPIEDVVEKVTAPDTWGGMASFDVELITQNPDGRDGVPEVKLSFASMVRGAKILHSYVRGHAIGACVGINPAGIFLATYLQAQLKLDRRCLGLILVDIPHAQGKRGLFTLPRKCLDGDVLLVDSQLKTGSAAEKAFIAVSKHYPGKKIWYVVLVACGIDAKTIKRAKKPGKTKAGPLLKSILKERTAECSKPNAVKHIPSRVVYFTPNLIRLPDGFF